MTSGIPPRRTRDGRIYGKKIFRSEKSREGTRRRVGGSFRKFFVIMDIDRINAICAEIDDGMKSFGKNREWDFTAAVRPAGTDTGTAPADKWAMVNRLLADLDKIREKESKEEEERISVCLPEKKDDVCPVSDSKKDSVTVNDAAAGKDPSLSVSGKESVTEKKSAAGNDTGFSFSGKGKNRAAVVTLARHEYDAVEDSVRMSADDGRLIPSALRLYSLVRAYGYAGVRPAPLHTWMLRALCSPRNSDRCAAILKDAGLLEVTGGKVVWDDEKKEYRRDPYRYAAVPPSCPDLFPDRRPAMVRIPLTGPWGRIAETELRSAAEEADPGKKLKVVSIDADEKLLVDGVKEIIMTAAIGCRKPEGIIRKAKKGVGALTRSRNLPEKKEKLISSIVYKIIKHIYTFSGSEKERLNIINLLYLSPNGKKDNVLGQVEACVFQSVTDSPNSPKNGLKPLFAILVSGETDTQSVRPVWNLKIGQYDRRPDMSYYSGLSYTKSAVAACLTVRDLCCLAGIDETPKYRSDGKLYSRLAVVRRAVRRHITFGGSRLVEAADIHSAHFTFLPEVFRRRGIQVSAGEIERWTALTRSGRLYDDIAGVSGLTRAEVKSGMQPFLSMKSRGQYLHGRKKDDEHLREVRRRIVRYFDDRFPGVCRALSRWHERFPDVTIKSESNRVESDLMNPVCDALRAGGLHPFRVHDAVYLPEDEIRLQESDIKDSVFRMLDDACRTRGQLTDR